MGSYGGGSRQSAFEQWLEIAAVPKAMVKGSRRRDQLFCSPTEERLYNNGTQINGMTFAKGPKPHHRYGHLE